MKKGSKTDFEKKRLSEHSQGGAQESCEEHRPRPGCLIRSWPEFTTTRVSVFASGKWDYHARHTALMSWL